MSERSFDEPMTGDLANLEIALLGLRPSASQLDRDRLMFEAGRASVGGNRTALLASKQWHTDDAPHRWLWPTATAVMTGVAAVLAALLLIPSSPSDVEPFFVTESVPASPNVAEPSPLRAATAREQGALVPNEASYLVLRHRFTGADASSPVLEIPNTSKPSREGWGNLLEMRHRFFGNFDSVGDFSLPDLGEES